MCVSPMQTGAMSNPYGTIEVDSYLPCGGRALIRPDPRKTMTQGGIELPGGGTHGNVRLGMMIDQGPARWDEGFLAPLPVPDFNVREDGEEVRVMYFEARLTPVRVWTREMEDIPDPKWRPPVAPTIPDASWSPAPCPQISDPKWEKPAIVLQGEPKPKAPLIDDPEWDEAAAEAKRPDIIEPGYVEPERPLVSVKVYEELSIIPHPAILGEVEVEEMPDDVDESELVPEGSVKKVPDIVRPSAALTAAVSGRQIPRGKVVGR